MHFRSGFEGVSLLPSFTSMRTNISFSDYGVFVLCVKLATRAEVFSYVSYHRHDEGKICMSLKTACTLQDYLFVLVHCLVNMRC